MFGGFATNMKATISGAQEATDVIPHYTQRPSSVPGIKCRVSHMKGLSMHLNYIPVQIILAGNSEAGKKLFSAFLFPSKYFLE